jgi:hypothetical protein
MSGLNIITVQECSADERRRNNQLARAHSASVNRRKKRQEGKDIAPSGLNRQSGATIIPRNIRCAPLAYQSTTTAAQTVEVEKIDPNAWSSPGRPRADQATPEQMLLHDDLLGGEWNESTPTPDEVNNNSDRPVSFPSAALRYGAIAAKSFDWNSQAAAAGELLHDREYLRQSIASSCGLIRHQ